MFNTNFRFIAFALSFWVAAPVFAIDATQANANIRAALKGLVPDVEVDTIEKSPVSGLYEVTIGPEVYYVSEDGRYLLMGKMLDVSTREDVSEGKMSKGRLKVLEQFTSKDLITYSPKTKAKHHVTVFTDIDCGYCRKFHSELETYLAKGIEVRYLFYPRSGVGSDSYKKAVSIWCAADRAKALTDAKLHDQIEAKQCDHPLLKHMEAAHRLGLEGTPMIILEDGRRVAGYLDANDLAAKFDNKSAARASRPQADPK